MKYVYQRETCEGHTKYLCATWDVSSTWFPGLHQSFFLWLLAAPSCLSSSDMGCTETGRGEPFDHGRSWTTGDPNCCRGRATGSSYRSTSYSIPAVSSTSFFISLNNRPADRPQFFSVNIVNNNTTHHPSAPPPLPLQFPPSETSDRCAHPN